MKLTEKNAASAFDHFMKVLDDFWLPRSAGKRRPQLASCVARARARARVEERSMADVESTSAAILGSPSPWQPATDVTRKINNSAPGSN